MRLVSYNIQFGRGKDNRTDLARIAASVDGADVIALQEVERFFTRSGTVDQVEALAHLLPDYHWVYGPGLDLDASIAGADGKPVHRRRQFGNMLLSRGPVLEPRTTADGNAAQEQQSGNRLPVHHVVSKRLSS